MVFLPYFLVKEKGKPDFLLLNQAITTMLLLYGAQLFSSIIVLRLFSHETSQGFFHVFIIIGLQSIFLSIMAFLYKGANSEALLKTYSSKNTSFLLLYYFLIAILIAYTAHHYQIFQQFIIGIAIFLFIQATFVIYLFIRITEKQKISYDMQLAEQEVNSLKKYTHQLEEHQEQLSRFKHDYKNLLISLKESVSARQEQKSIDSIKELEDYSASYFSTPKFDAFQCKNIHEPRLKSLVVAKLFEASEHHIDCHFECLDPIDKVPIPIYDCIRVLGIALDNAIKEAKECPHAKLSFMIFQDKHQVEFLIEHTYPTANPTLEDRLKKGTTVKHPHQGLGFSSIQSIKKKNPNLLTQQQRNPKNYSVQFIMQWK